MKFFVSLVLVVGVWAGEDGGKRPHWGYEGDHGPAHWPEMFGPCSGTSQSPVNINVANKEEVVYDENLTDDLDLLTAITDANYFMVNNAHTVYTDVMGADISMIGLQLGAAYKVVGPHFHWGEDDTTGSEHMLNGKQFPLEMHIVTYNEEKFGTLKEAAFSGQPGALAVIGVFFEISEEDNPALTPIVDQLQNVQHPDKLYRHEVKPYSISDLLPAETGEYFRYEGSLTTPSCEEVVRWTVMLHPQTVSQAQLEKFRAVQVGDDVPLVNNYRPVQPLNGRKVTKSFMYPAITPLGRKAPKEAAEAASMDNAGNANVIGAISTVVAVVIAAMLL